jgi:hypothetical protein
VLLFLGILFGAFAPREAWWKSRAFFAGSVAALVFTIVAFASYAVAPDWMWMYFLDPGDVAWSLPAIAIGYLVAFGMGFAAAVALKSLSTRLVVAAAASMLAAEIVVLAITWSRYHEVGTRAEWLRGGAHELFTARPSGPVATIGVLVPVFFAVLAAALFYTWRATRAGSSVPAREARS